MSSVAGAITGGLGSIMGGIGGMISGMFGSIDIPEGPKGPDPWEEYDTRRTELARSRTKDYSSAKARLAASGLAPNSSGWESSLESILTSYDEKLDELGKDPYFEDVRSNSGFGTWGKPPADAPDWYLR